MCFFFFSWLNWLLFFYSIFLLAYINVVCGGCVSSALSIHNPCGMCFTLPSISFTSDAGGFSVFFLVYFGWRNTIWTYNNNKNRKRNRSLFMNSSTISQKYTKHWNNVLLIWRPKWVCMWYELNMWKESDRDGMNRNNINGTQHTHKHTKFEIIYEKPWWRKKTKHISTHCME